MYIFFFFFNDTATTEIYTLSLHDALPISEIYWDTNVSGSLALLEAMRAADCRRIVFSSSAATYGEPDQVPIREDAPTRPTNTYGASKLAVRSEEHTSELQSRQYLVCRLLLEKKNTILPRTSLIGPTLVKTSSTLLTPAYHSVIPRSHNTGIPLLLSSLMPSSAVHTILPYT